MYISTHHRTVFLIYDKLFDFMDKAYKFLLALLTFLKKSMFMKKTLILCLLLALRANLLPAIVDTPLANFSAAQRAWLLNQRQESFELYLKESETSAQKQIPLTNAATIRFIESDLSSSDKFVNRALQIDPNYGPALLLKGQIEFQRGNIRAGTIYLRAAAKNHPHPEIPLFYLCYHLAKRNQLKEPLEVLKDAVSENKQFTPPYPLIGEILIKQGKIKDAVEVLTNALKISYDAEILLTLARATEKAGNLTEAKKYFGLFSYLFPKHPENINVLNWLKNNGVTKPYSHQFKPIPTRNTSDRFLPIGENFVYCVDWGPIRVGELKTVVAETLRFQNHDAYKVIFSLDSNPALEFIASLHSDYITIIDQSTKQVLQHFLHIRENNIVSDKVYDFETKTGKFICRSIEEDGHIQILEKYLPENTIDGTSILFYSRQVVKEKRKERVMTIIDENFVITDINYENRKEPVAVRNKTENALVISGENYYKGIVGLTGKFRGWFRDDRTFLPVRSDFEIWVGRIAISMADEEEQRQHKYAR